MFQRFGNFTWLVVLIIVLAFCYLLERYRFKAIIGLALLIIVLFVINPRWFDTVKSSNYFCKKLQEMQQNK